MACRIEVGAREAFFDSIGHSLQERISSELGLQGVKSVQTLKSYTIEEDLPDSELEGLASSLFSDAVTERFAINKPLSPPQVFDFAIKVSFLPGVKDNSGDAAREAIEDFLHRRLRGGVFSSTCYFLSGKVARKDAERVASELLANELIHSVSLKSSSEFGTEGFSTQVPKVQVAGGGLVSEINLSLPDKALEQLSGQRILSLSLQEMKKIREHFLDPDTASTRKRMGISPNPTDAELECIAQTWSEHCKHKIFNAKIRVQAGKKKKIVNSLFKSYIRALTAKLSRRKKWLLSVFSDNAGIVEFVPGYSVAMKVETHNSPSALDPFGGALTGILGVNRDVLGCGLGAKPIFNTDVFCFAPPDYAGPLPPRLFHPRRVLEGVRAGVAHGGNASGIPTVNGAVVFDERYLGKPLVYCGTAGIMPTVVAGKKSHEKRAAAGDRIFMVGGKIGKDGIHGATFSSTPLHEGSPVSAVQLGDPYTQKKVIDFLLEARDAGLYNSLTDNGAGGLSSSVGEMAQDTGGAKLHLDRAPLKYPGLDPWEILVSESQERMSVAVPPSKAGDFAQLAYLRGVEVSDLGEFTSSGFLHVLYGAKTVAYLEMDFLHHGLPQLQLDAQLSRKKLAEPALGTPSDFSPILLSLLSRPNICSKEYFIRQYDHEVQGSSVLKPLCGKGHGPSDAAVISPLFERKEALVVSNGICPRYSDIDCYQMAANAVDEAVRNYVCAGGDLSHLSALDNFCWPDPIHSSDNPDGKHKLAQLFEACRGLYDACLAYEVPLISGKDSMKNDYRHGRHKISVPPTLLVSAIGTMPDADLAMASNFKEEGDLIYVLGQTKDELGGSEYYAAHSQLGANVPVVNFKKNLVLYKKLQSAIQKGLLSSAHDCSEGGIGVALAECCIGGNLGASVDLAAHCGKLPDASCLFSESAGRFIVSVKKGNEARFKSAMKGVSAQCIGKVGGDHLSIKLGGRELVNCQIEKMISSWKGTMSW